MIAESHETNMEGVQVINLTQHRFWHFLAWLQAYDTNRLILFMEVKDDTSARLYSNTANFTVLHCGQFVTKRDMRVLPRPRKYPRFQTIYWIRNRTSPMFSGKIGHLIWQCDTSHIQSEKAERLIQRNVNFVCRNTVFGDAGVVHIHLPSICYERGSSHTNRSIRRYVEEKVDKLCYQHVFLCWYAVRLTNSTVKPQHELYCMHFQYNNSFSKLQWLSNRKK